MYWYARTLKDEYSDWMKMITQMRCMVVKVMGILTQLQFDANCCCRYSSTAELASYIAYRQRLERRAIL